LKATVLFLILKAKKKNAEVEVEATVVVVVVVVFGKSHKNKLREMELVRLCEMPNKWKLLKEEEENENLLSGRLSHMV
jgi:hypothetical protein